MPLPSLPFFKKTTQPTIPEGSPVSPSSQTAPPAAETPTPPQTSPTVTPGTVSVQDIIAPPAIEVDFTSMKIGSYFVRSLFVVGYPRYVSANWLSPLINFNHSLDISMFIYPVESKGTLDQLRRRIAEMEAEISADIEKGRIPHASTEAQLEDAKSLQEQLVKGIERFFNFSLYITISAETQKELDTITNQVQSTLGSLMIISKAASLSMEDAFKSTLPYCKDRLLITRNMDTTALSTTFPFTSSELSDNKGILYGINEHNKSLIVFDRFSLENANMLVLATSGAGKSISYKMDVIVKNSANEVKRTQIGKLIEKIIKQKGLDYNDGEMEGKSLPGYKVWTFNPQSLEGQWSTVSLAARKKSPKTMYRFTTKSGREITTTGDHNMLVLKDTKINVEESRNVREGDYLPLPRLISSPQPRISDKKLAYYTLLGYYTAEGCTAQNSKSKRAIITNTNQTIIEHVQTLGDQLGFKVRVFKRRNLNYGLDIYSKLLIRELKLDKCHGYAHQKKVPTTLFKQNNQTKAVYLRAYFDGDGCVEQHEVTATTKSKNLASDLSYLLYNFGIIARLKPKFKRATNSKHKGDIYHQVTISGQENLRNFLKHIGFGLEYKQQKLKTLVEKAGNSNVDVIPELQKPLKKIYRILYSYHRIGAPQKLIDIKNGSYNPTRQELNKLIEEIQPRIREIRKQEQTIYDLLKLPAWQDLIPAGEKNKKINKQLWQQLGHTWQVFRSQTIRPQINTVLKIYQTTSGKIIEKENIYTQINSSFKVLGLSLSDFDYTLHQAVTQTGANTWYDRITAASQFLLRAYLKLQEDLKDVNQTLVDLVILAQSDLFWDPIAKIEKLKSKRPYVYDLTVNNEVFLAGHGGLFVHNSFAVKLEILRSVMFGVEVIVLDPENEYEMLAKSVGGNYITFSIGSANRINPFELSDPKHSTEDELSYKFLFLLSLLKIMLGSVDPNEDAVLNHALILTYQQKGISMDPSTHTNEAPRMEDLYKALIGMENPLAAQLANRLEKYVKGALRGIFDQPSNIELGAQMTVFTLRELADEIRPIVMFMILDFIWSKIRRTLKKRLLVVDEAWYIMRYEDSAKILESFVKRARKYYLGVTVISQNADDFLNSKYGKAIVPNSALQLLMKQSPAAIDQVAQVFYLSQGERQLLLSAGVGEGLFFAGHSHVAIHITASPDEHVLVTSKPSEILKRQTEQAAKPETSTDNQPEPTTSPAML